MNPNQPNNNVNNNVEGVPTTSPLVSDISSLTNPPTDPSISVVPTTEAPTTAPTVEVEQKDTKQGNGKFIILICFSIVLILIVWFLPDISKKVEELMSKNKPMKIEKIVDGEMECKIERRTETLTKKHTQTFMYSHNQLDRLKYVVETTGNSSELGEISTQCQNVESLANNIDGLTIKCETFDTSVREVYDFNFALLDYSSISSDYSEAGGVNPAGYDKGDDMDKIEKEMAASGYDCVRKHSDS